MSTALDRIIAYKVDEVAAAKRETPLAALEARLPEASPPRGFAQSMSMIAGLDENALICELKRKSPSAGDILPGADPIQIAREYESGGAACADGEADCSMPDGVPLAGAQETSASPVAPPSRTVTSLPAMAETASPGSRITPVRNTGAWLT